MNRVFENLRGRLLGGPIRRFYALRAAQSIATEISYALEMDEALKILVNRIASYMSVEIISVMLIDSEKKRLVVNIAKGLGDEIVKDSESRGLGEGVAGWVGKTGEPLLISDITKDSRFSVRQSGRYYNNSLLSVPLKVRDRVFGVINVNNKTSHDIFRHYDLVFLRTVASISAIAIDNIRLQEEAKKAAKNNYEVVANVSHDLKTPLATIHEALLLILEGTLGKLNEKQEHYLDLAKQNTDRLHRMINELLESARAEHGKALMKRNYFSITDTAKSILDSLSVVAKEKGVSIKSAIPDKSIQIWGDPDKLNEVISNLIDNAIKYNRPDGKVDVAMSENETSITISVSDSGMGITKEDMNRIFERFYRSERNAKEGIPGTGLGLSIVQDIVKMHKGEISVKSEEDKGTTFTVTLPKSLRK